MNKPRFSIYEGELGRNPGPLSQPDFSSLPPMDFLGYVTPLGDPKDRFFINHIRFPWEPLPGRHVRTLVVRECCQNLAMIERWMEPAAIAESLTKMRDPRSGGTRAGSEFLKEIPSFLHPVVGKEFSDPFHLYDVLTALAKVEKGITRALCGLEAGRIMEEMVTESSAEGGESENPRFLNRVRPLF